MIFLVDIGNTRLKYTTICGDDITDISSVELADINDDWCENNWPNATEIILASVNQAALTLKITNWAKRQNIRLKQVKSSLTAYGVRSGYLHAEQLGVDRWLVIIAAAIKYPHTNTLIIDAGTATTVDLVKANGQHCGGWILPGINSMMKSLITDTAKVKFQYSKPSLTFGDNTSDNVNNACWAATIGTIKMAIRESTEHCQTLDNILLTGGNAEKISSLLDVPHTVESNLVFIGLKEFAN